MSAMPHPHHGEISPCDFNSHSDAKETERASRPADASDAEITIRTLHFLGLVEADAVRSYWRHNFMLDAKKLSYAAYVDGQEKGREKIPEARRRLHEQ